MSEEVQRVWPDECDRLGRADVPKLVSEAVHRAEQHGLRFERDLGRFVHLVFALEDPVFDTRAWAAELLREHDCPPHIRLHHVWHAARARLDRGVAR